MSETLDREKEAAVLRSVVWRLANQSAESRDAARSALRVMLSGGPRTSPACAANALDMLTRFPATVPSSPGRTVLPHRVPPFRATGPNACPTCGPDMLITVLIEPDPNLELLGAERHTLRCLGCRHEEQRIAEAR